MTLKQFVDRYGLTLGIVALFALVVALLPGNTNGASVSTTGGELGNGSTQGSAVGSDDLAGGSGGDVSTGGGGTSGGGGGATGAGGGGGTGGAVGGSGPVASGGSEVVFGKGPDCDKRGRQIGVSPYMPQCVQWLGDNNGGATARGVTAKSVTIVSWLGQEDPATRQALTAASLNDQPATVKRSYEALFKYSNAHYQTYGRKVNIIQLNASGESTDDAAMIADAVKIANEIKAFAVFTGNALAPIPNKLARELAQRGVVCICTTSLSSAYYNELPATIFSSLPTIDEYASQSAEYAAKKLAGKKATLGGADVRTKQRVFCLMYLNGAKTTVDPEGDRMRRIFVAAWGRVGIRFKTQIAYLYNPGSNQNDVTAMMTKFKSEGCTTLVPLVDPIQPILITKEATKQVYFPEWFVVGTGLSDTTTIARFYDQDQWQHAFGISPLWVTWDKVENSPGYREYHDAVPGSPKGEEGTLINIYRAAPETLFRGIQLAGPILNNQTFAQGMYRFLPTGGTPANPLVFFTRQYPTGIKDYSEIWYDRNRVGPDERSKSGAGMIVRADGGRRYKLGQWATGNPSRANGVTVTPQQGLGQPRSNADRYKHACLSCDF